MKRAFSILVALGSLAVAQGPALAALPCYMKVTGERQGNIRGDVTLQGREGTIEVFQLSHEIVSPRDPATGLPTGKRQHKPFTIKMEVDRSTAKLFQALVSNEKLTTVELKFWAPDPRGVVVEYFTIKLTNAYIASIQTVLPDAKNQGAQHALYEEIAFVYEKIEWTHVTASSTAQDSWDSPVN